MDTTLAPSLSRSGPSPWALAAAGTLFSFLWASAFIAGKIGFTACGPLTLLSLRFTLVGGGLAIALALQRRGLRVSAATAGSSIQRGSRPPWGRMSHVSGAPGHRGAVRTAAGCGFAVGAAGGALLGRTGQYFTAFDTSYRSSFSSSASASTYLVVDGYSLVNARVGFRAADGWTLSVWSRNLLNKDYFDLLSAAPGNTGLYVGQPGDPRTFGVTMRVALRQ